jgi:hypothetical protein
VSIDLKKLVGLRLESLETIICLRCGGVLLGNGPIDGMSSLLKI